jgi:hypothetical protein
MIRKWKEGDWAVYRKQKSSTSPGQRAKMVNPSTSGETYRYMVEKYWIVDRVLPDGSLVLRTRRGKEHVVAIDDLNLRRPNLIEKLFRRSRFTDFKPCQSGVSSQSLPTS